MHTGAHNRRDHIENDIDARAIGGGLTGGDKIFFIIIDATSAPKPEAAAHRRSGRAQHCVAEFARLYGHGVNAAGPAMYQKHFSPSNCRLQHIGPNGENSFGQGGGIGEAHGFGHRQ